MSGYPQGAGRSTLLRAALLPPPRRRPYLLRILAVAVVLGLAALLVGLLLARTIPATGPGLWLYRIHDDIWLPLRGRLVVADFPRSLLWLVPMAGLPALVAAEALTPLRPLRRLQVKSLAALARSDTAARLILALDRRQGRARSQRNPILARRKLFPPSPRAATAGPIGQPAAGQTGGAPGPSAPNPDPVAAEPGAPVEIPGKAVRLSRIVVTELAMEARDGVLDQEAAALSRLAHLAGLRLRLSGSGQSDLIFAAEALVLLGMADRAGRLDSSLDDPGAGGQAPGSGTANQGKAATLAQLLATALPQEAGGGVDLLWAEALGALQQPAGPAELSALDRLVQALPQLAGQPGLAALLVLRAARLAILTGDGNALRLFRVWARLTASAEGFGEGIDDGAVPSLRRAEALIAFEYWAARAESAVRAHQLRQPAGLLAEVLPGALLPLDRGEVFARSGASP